MIILLFKLIIITSILVLAWTIVTQPTMALGWIREWAGEKLDKGDRWVEPTLLCHWCMPSVWTLWGFAFAFGLDILEYFEWKLILLYILTVGGSSVLNGLVWGLHRFFESSTNKNEAAEQYYNNAQKVQYLEIEKMKALKKRYNGN